MGFCPQSMVLAQFVFISHGHIDHIGAICQHMRKRHLNHLTPAIYFMSKSVLLNVRKMCEIYEQLSEKPTGTSEFSPNLVGIEPGKRYHVSFYNGLFRIFINKIIWY